MEDRIQKIYICESDIADGEMRGLKVDGQWILVVHHNGNYYALDAACAHAGYPLFKGSLNKDGVITCALHYMQFDCKTGKVVSDPAVCENQTIFEIEVSEGKVYWLKKEEV